MPEPSIIVVYGHSKSGKTTDMLYSFPNALYLVPALGGLAPYVHRTGIKPDEVLCNNVKEAQQKMEKAQGRAVVLEDFSVMAERTKTSLRNRNITGWQLWTGIADQIEDLRETAIKKNILTLAITCHLQDPTRGDDGTYYRGGPKMPSKTIVGALPHIASEVVRTGTDLMVQPPLYNGAYICDLNDRSYITGDRYGVLPQPKAPMNMREVLVQAKAQGNDIVVPPRPASVAWIEPIVEEIAQNVIANTGLVPAQVAAQMGAAFKGRDLRHLNWALRDGYARAKLRSYSPYEAFLSPGGLQ